MGSTGKAKVVSGSDDSLKNKPTSDTDKYTDFNSPTGAEKWFANPKLSNSEDWHNNQLTGDEEWALRNYTGSGYDKLNSELYETPWDKLDSTIKEKASNIYEALNKFELNHGISVDRATSTLPFGKSGMTADEVREAILQNPVRQHNGFMSFSTDKGGHGVEKSDIVVTLKIPPSTGAGAWVKPLSGVKGENEFLVNSNAVIRYDPKSVTEKYGKIYVTGYWLGQGSDQVFDNKKK